MQGPAFLEKARPELEVEVKVCEVYVTLPRRDGAEVYQREWLKGGKGASQNLCVPSPPFLSFCPSTLPYNESPVVVAGLGSPLYHSAQEHSPRLQHKHEKLDPETETRESTGQF